MPHFSIIQFMPDPVKDERINIGVLAFDGPHVGARFVKSWHRAKLIGGANVQFLRDFSTNLARRLTLQAEGEDQFRDDISEEWIRHVAYRWRGSIRFSQPRPSTLDLHRLLDFAERTFLTSTKSQESKGKYYNSRIVKRAATLLRKSLRKRQILDDTLVDVERPLHGGVVDHTVDVVLHSLKAPDRLTCVAQSLSFDQDPKRVMDRVGSIGFMVPDIKKNIPDLAVYVLTSKVADTSIPIFREARAICKYANAEIVQYEDLKHWSDQMITKAAEAH